MEITDYADMVISKLELLATTGKLYRTKLYKITNVLDYYIEQMKLQHNNMGEKYITEMSNNIIIIFTNVSRYTNYDILEYVNLVIVYVFNTISFRYTKKQIQPKLPDYTLAELHEYAKLLNN